MSVPASPSAPTVVSPTTSDLNTPISSAPGSQGGAAPAPSGSSTDTNSNNGTSGTNAQPGSNNSNTDSSNASGSGLIKFSKGLDSIASASNLEGNQVSGFGGGVGTSGLSGEVMNGGWISEESLKQIAVHLTVFQPAPLVKTSGTTTEYKLLKNAGLVGGETGTLCRGLPEGQPNSLLPAVLKNNEKALGVDGNFKVGASYAFTIEAPAGSDNIPGIEYFKHYYPDLQINDEILRGWIKGHLLNVEIIVPTSETAGNAYRLKIVDQGPKLKTPEGLGIIDIMSPWALLSSNKDIFTVTAEGGLDVTNSTEWKFPFADKSYDYLTGEIDGFGPSAEIKWGLTSHDTIDIKGFDIKKAGPCRAKFFIDPSHKEQAEKVAGKALPEELFKCNGTYGSGSTGSADAGALKGTLGYGAVGDGYQGIATSMVTDEQLLAIINKKIEYAPVTYPPLETPCFWQLYKGNSIFGKHGQYNQTVVVHTPAGWPLYYDDRFGKGASGKIIHNYGLRVHKLIAPRVEAAFRDIFNHYGPQLSSIIPSACWTGGAYVDKAYGSYWSSHAYGVAIDFDPYYNDLKTSMRRPEMRNTDGELRPWAAGSKIKCPTMAEAIYKPWWEIWYHHGFYSQGIESEITRKRPGNAHDWMHIQFAHWNCGR
jgi:hypothetical protein